MMHTGPQVLFFFLEALVDFTGRFQHQRLFIPAISELDHCTLLRFFVLGFVRLVNCTMLPQKNHSHSFFTPGRNARHQNTSKKLVHSSTHNTAIRGGGGWGCNRLVTSIGELTLGPFPCQLSPVGDVFSA